MKERAFGNARWASLLNFVFYDKRMPGVIRGWRRSIKNLRADIELDGVRFRCYPFDNAHDLAILQGTLFESEREEYRFMEDQLRDGGYFIDIGANVGAICIPLALRASATVRVIAIEPNPVNVKRLQYNASLNNIANFAILPYAVGSLQKAPLYNNNRNNSGQASLYKIDGSGLAAGYIEVEAKPLLYLLSQGQVPSINLLKVDIEGYEDKALLPFFREAPRTLWPKAIVIEHAHKNLWEEDCIAVMKELGYEIVSITSMNTMLVNLGSTRRQGDGLSTQRYASKALSN